MPTGQEELTRERRERLKEVKFTFWLWQWKQKLKPAFWDKYIMFIFQAKDCLLKTIGEDAKRLVSPTYFTQSYRARFPFFRFFWAMLLLCLLNPLSTGVTRNLTWSQSWGVPGALVLASLSAPFPSMNMSIIVTLILSKACLEFLASAQEAHEWKWWTETLDYCLCWSLLPPISRWKS